MPTRRCQARQGVDVTNDPTDLFQRARRIAETDRAEAVLIFKRVAELPPGPEWSDAQLEVAGWEHQHHNLEEARRRYQSILDADSAVTSPTAWRTAAVMICSVHEDMDRPVDPDLLRRGLEACESTHEEHDAYLAGIAAGHLARIERAAGRSDMARHYFERAVPHYDASGSMIGGPGSALEIARLLVADGDVAAAREWLRRGLEHLAQFPHGGRSVRDLREKLESVASQIGS